MKAEKKTGIYKITNKEDGKIYIGQAKDLEKRWETHRKTKYPEDQFTYEIIMECDLEQLNFWEIAWITSENACDPAVGYNKALGGTSLKSIIPSDETRAKISAASKACVGRECSDETRAKISAAQKGKKLTDEHKAKISAAQKSKKLTDEARAKMSAANKGKKFTDEHKAKMSAAQKARWSRNGEIR